MLKALKATHLQPLQLCFLVLYVPLLCILLSLPCLLLVCEPVLQIAQLLQLLVVPIHGATFTPILLYELGLARGQLSLQAET